MALAESSRLLCRSCLAESNSKHSFTVFSSASIYTAGLAKTCYCATAGSDCRQRTSSEAFVQELQSKVVGGGEATDFARTSSGDLREGVGYGFREVRIVWKL